ncbi:MAG: hypothetical protein H6Q84_3389, partial [Deltaproteobacteria bacterium]|nr:hypothetical protein [Deltaproteobacteria bacterium]
PWRSIAASLGGIGDAKGGLDGTGIEAGLRAIRRNGIPVIEEAGSPTLAADVRRRLELYDRALGGHEPAVFINVGGSMVSVGDGMEAHRLPTGLLKKVPTVRSPERGVIYRMGERGVPVIHLLEIRSLAARYGIPFDPPPLASALPTPPPAAGSYSAPLAAAGLALMIVLLVLLGKADREQRAGIPGPAGD